MGVGVVPEADMDAVVANLVNDIMVTNNGHTSSGIVGIRYIHREAGFMPSCVWTLACSACLMLYICLYVVATSSLH